MRLMLLVLGLSSSLLLVCAQQRQQQQQQQQQHIKQQRQNKPIIHMHLVDIHRAAGSNTSSAPIAYLFRSGDPCTAPGHTYNMQAVRSTMRSTALAEANISMPVGDFYVIDINVENLLDKLLPIGSDGPHVVSEMTYFKKNPSQGRFLFWQCVGTSDHARDKLFDAVRQDLAISVPDWETDRLVMRSAALWQMLTSPSRTPVAIVFHCDCG